MKIDDLTWDDSIYPRTRTSLQTIAAYGKALDAGATFLSIKVQRVFNRLTRLGWTQGKMADKVGLSQNRVSEIIGITNIGNIDTLLSRGHDMEYIARHFQMDLPLAHKNTKPTTTLAFLNADWYNLQATEIEPDKLVKSVAG
ncbi:MAG: hypothetical protein ABR534_15060 [Desulfotignum sp.]|nr:hypothetical protein [Desulfobacteraceae bacterium]